MGSFFSVFIAYSSFYGIVYMDSYRGHYDCYLGGMSMNRKYCTEMGRRILREHLKKAQSQEMKAILARTNSVSDQRIQLGGKGSSTLADIDQKLAFATRNRMLYEAKVRDNASAVMAPDPKDIGSVQLGHRVVCVCFENYKGTESFEEFMFRMGGFAEDLEDGDVLVCDYSRPIYAKFLHCKVGDEINFPGKGHAQIVKIMMPYDPLPV